MAGLVELENGYKNRDACWLLIATIVSFVVILALQVACALNGVGKPIYLVIVSCVLVANVIALVLCRRKPERAVLSFSWVTFAAIAGMLAIDAVQARDSFPTIANLFAIIAISTAYVVGLRRAIPHIVADVIVLAWLSTLYGLSDTVPILAACTIGGALVGRLRDELHRNRKKADMATTAIHTYIAEKRNGYKSNEDA